MKSKRYIWITVLALTVVSCHENDIVYNTQDVEYRPMDFAVPVATIYAPLYQILGKTFDDMFVDDNDVICIRYTQSQKVEWKEDIRIEDYYVKDQSTEWIYDLDNLNPMPEDESKLKGAQAYPVELTTDKAAGSYITEAELSAGRVKLSVDPGSLTSYNILIIIPELITNEGKAFAHEFSHETTTEYEGSLEGYKIITDGRRMNVICEITVEAASFVSGQVKFDFSLYDMDIDYLSGYFGQWDYKYDDGELYFDFFDKWDFQTVGFQGIKMDAVVTNWAGLPTNVEADVFFGYTSGEDELLEWVPELNFSVPGATESGSNHSITPANVAFSTMLPVKDFESSRYPTRLIFKVEGEANPDGDDDVNNFYVKKDDGILVDVAFDLIMPLIVKVDEYSRMDTVAFDYNKITNDNEDFSNSIKDMTINLEIVNGMPFEIMLSIFAIDAEDERVETILVNEIIPVQEETQYVSVILTPSQLSNFWERDVKNLVLHTIAKTEGERYVEVKKDSFVEIFVSTCFTADVLSIIY